LFGPGPARLAEGGAEGFGIGHDGVAGKVQRLTGALRRVGMAGAAGIFDHHRNDSEIGGVARGRLDADFHRNAHHGKRTNPFTRGISSPKRAQDSPTPAANRNFGGQPRCGSGQGAAERIMKIHPGVVNHFISRNAK
jgi:hypothetical protein